MLFFLNGLDENCDLAQALKLLVDCWLLAGCLAYENSIVKLVTWLLNWFVLNWGGILRIRNQRGRCGQRTMSTYTNYDEAIFLSKNTLKFDSYKYHPHKQPALWQKPYCWMARRSPVNSPLELGSFVFPWLTAPSQASVVNKLATSKSPTIPRLQPPLNLTSIISDQVKMSSPMISKWPWPGFFLGKMWGLAMGDVTFLQFTGWWWVQMDVSENSGIYPPKSSSFNRVFHYKPSILGHPYFWKHSNVLKYFHPEKLGKMNPFDSRIFFLKLGWWKTTNWIIMVQWKMGVSPIFYRYLSNNIRSHFPLNHDYGRKG